jgi:hypothetical protein
MKYWQILQMFQHLVRFYYGNEVTIEQFTFVAPLDVGLSHFWRDLDVSIEVGLYHLLFLQKASV